MHGAYKYQQQTWDNPKTTDRDISTNLGQLQDYGQGHLNKPGTTQRLRTGTSQQTWDNRNPKTTDRDISTNLGQLQDYGQGHLNKPGTTPRLRTGTSQQTWDNPKTTDRDGSSSNIVLEGVSSVSSSCFFPG